MANVAIPNRATVDGISPTPALASKNERAMTFEERSDHVRELVRTLENQAATAVQRRKPTEERWLKDLRQFHGLYESDIDSILREDPARSKIFVNITRTKTNGWNARLGDLLFPNDEKNWGIDPTPVPDLAESAKAAVTEALAMDERAETAISEHNAAIDAGQEPDPMHAAIAGEAAAAAKRLRDVYDEEQQVLEEARKRARNMEREIDDQLTEANYPGMCRRIIEDATKLGSGILKGPFVAGQSRPRWADLSKDAQTTANGSTALTGFQLKATNDNAPMFRRVDPWHFFPDPDAETLDDAEYVLERHLPNRKKLRRMARELQFDEDAVRHLLKEGPQHNSGASGDLAFMMTLRTLENGGEVATDASSAIKDRYLIWEYTGTLEPDVIATMIRGHGRLDDAEKFSEESDPLIERTVRVFFCGTVLLKIEEDYLLDRGDFIYSVFPFERSEASILGGVGIPHLMRHEQAMLNSSVRMMMDNAGLAVGPQVLIDKTQIEPEDGNWRMVPRKVWRWIKNKGDQKQAPLQTFDIPMNQAMLSAIIDIALKFVDEVVAMPLIAQGEQGQHVTKTMGGMSMLFNSANVVFRRVVKNWDDAITEPTITRSYDFNMQFSEKDSIKGDMTIEARGTSVLLVREMQAEQMLAITEKFSTHPVLGVAIKAYDAMRLVLQAMGINPADVLLEEEEYKEKLQQMAEAEAQGGASPEEVRAQTQLQVAQLEQQTKMAEMSSNEKVAEMRMATEFAQLAQSKEISMAQIQAMFSKEKLAAVVKDAASQRQAESKERTLAAEIAVEQDNAREARQRGEEPSGSGGVVSMGASDS